MKEASALIDQIVQVAPKFEETYHEHMRRYGELLAHVLMGDFTRWFIDLCRGIAADPERIDFVAERDAIIHVLDSSLLQGDEATQGVILASFLENLQQAGKDYDLVLRSPNRRTSRKAKTHGVKASGGHEVLRSLRQRQQLVVSEVYDPAGNCANVTVGRNPKV